jgi:hypothetical protein
VGQSSPGNSISGYYRFSGVETSDKGSPEVAAPNESTIWGYTAVPGVISLKYTDNSSDVAALYGFMDGNGYFVVQLSSTGDTHHTAPVTQLKWVTTTAPPCRRSRLDSRMC